MLRRVRSWFGAVVRRSRMEREMDAELRVHIEVFAEDLVGSGVSREEALRRFVPGLSRFSSAGEVTCRVGCLSVH